MQLVWIVIAILLGLLGLYCTSDSPPDVAQLPDYVIGQDIADDPCTLGSESYIRTISGTRSGQDSITHRQVIRVSGGSSHTLFYDDADNLQGETYFIEGIAYSRELRATGDWSGWSVQKPQEPYEEQLETIAKFFEENPVSTFCGVQEIVDHKYLGRDTLDGTEVSRFSSRWPDDFLGGSDLSVDFEFWVDASGRLQQSKMTHKTKTFTDETVVRYTEHDSNIVIEPPDVP